MDTFDWNTEEEVWRRVLAAPGAMGEDVLALLEPAMDAAGDYGFLSCELRGPAREKAAQLLCRQRETVLCLRGILRLCGGQEPPRSCRNRERNMEKCLRNCCRRARQAAREYTSRTAAPDFGAAYQVLASRENENITTLLALLGSL